MMLLLLALSATAAAWDAMRGAAIVPSAPRSYAAGQMVRPMYFPGLLDEALLAEAARDSAALSLERLRRAGLAPSAACGHGTPVEIYLWPDDTLPIERFFPEGGAPIVGVYVTGPVDRVAIVAWASPRETYRVLVHELAHAWYRRACAEGTLGESSEAFAQAVDRRAQRDWDDTHAQAAWEAEQIARAPDPSTTGTLLRSTSTVRVQRTPTILEFTPVVLTVAPVVLTVTPTVIEVEGHDAWE
jgi:hypothetical protein